MRARVPVRGVVAAVATLVLALSAAPLAALADEHKVTICHVPPGNPEAAHEIEVSEEAWVDENGEAHSNHEGDFVVTADSPCPPVEEPPVEEPPVEEPPVEEPPVEEPPVEEPPREPVVVDVCRFVHDQLGDRTLVFRNVPANEANHLIEEHGFVAFEPGGPLPEECLPGEEEPPIVVLRPDVRVRIIEEGDVTFGRLDRDDIDQVIAPVGGVQAGGGLPVTGAPGWLPFAGSGLLGAGGVLWLIRRRWFS